jgi:hypothetical protein
MKISLFVVCAAAFLTSGAVAADEDAVAADKDTQESKPIELSAVQMDQITAGNLLLPNGKIQFDNFDNPAPNDPEGYIAEFLGACDGVGDGFCHPALNRRSDAAFVTAGKGPQVTPLGNDGPWVATVASPVISICGPTPDFPACP